jgi:exonuclease SbcC
VRPQRLQLAGLRSWQGEQELTFEGVDLAAVVGPTGAGKSSILEAIVYALFNAATYDNRLVSSLISSDVPTMRVTFDFAADGESWRVTRSTSRSSYPPAVHRLSCLTDPGTHPTVEGERAVNDAIRRLVGLDVDQFTTAVMLPQGRFQRLLTATPAERTGILKGVFRLDQLGETRERATAQRRDEVDPALDAALVERGRLLPDPRARLEEATAAVERAGELAAALRDRKQRHDAELARCVALRGQVEQARAQAAGLRAAAAAVPSLDAAVQVAAGLDREREELERRRAEQQGLRRDAQARLDAAAAEGEGPVELAAAAQALRAARTALPQLDEDERALGAERAEHERQAGELGQARALLEERAAELQRARAAVEGLRAGRDESARALAAVHAAERSRQQALAEGEAAARTAEEAEARAGAARAAADADAAALAGAEGVLRAAEREHQAAALAHGLHGGDPCPVCERELPDDFAPPSAPPALAGAEREVARLRAEAEGSAHQAAEAAAELRAARAGAEAAAAELARAERERRAAPGLEAVEEAARAASAAAAEAEETLRADEVAIAGLRAQLEAAEAQATSRDGQLAERAARIERDRGAHVEALAGLPALARPTTPRPAALERALGACERRLEGLAELSAVVRDAAGRVEQLDEGLRAVAERRRQEVDQPRRAAGALARDIAASLRALGGTPPAQPSDAATVHEHAAWAGAVVALAGTSATALDALAVEREAAIAEAGRLVRAALAEADALVEEEVSEAADLDAALHDWGARVRMAHATIAEAGAQVPRAEALDERIAELRGRRDALEEVARLLADGQFVSWVVGRRQQRLLVIASEILAGMTEDRFRFASDFAIVDRRTGVARNPKTLSGGESFLASLALALAMAELAARSGGRIESLYLDEGFGALDPNALDEAIDALEQRARVGQMILVISHVPAVAQRIERVLAVSPDPAGSTAEWLDDEDREAMLLAATAGELAGQV